MMSIGARRRDTEESYGVLARLRSPTEIQKTVTFHRKISQGEKERSLWEDFIIPATFYMEGGDPGVKVICNDSPSVNVVFQSILRQFTPPQDEQSERVGKLLQAEILDVSQIPGDRKKVVERWNKGDCKLLVIHRDVPEKKGLLPANRYIQFDFPFHIEHLATCHFARELNCDIFFNPSVDHQAVKALKRDYEKFEIGDFTWLENWARSVELGELKRPVPLM